MERSGGTNYADSDCARRRASSGALDTLKDEAKEAVNAAYGKLRDLVGRRFRVACTANGEAVLAEYEADPESFEKGLGKKLAEQAPIRMTCSWRPRPKCSNC